MPVFTELSPNPAIVAPSAPHPKPLLVVHQAVGILSTACGCTAGRRRFDVDLGTFVQDTAHLVLDVRQPEGLTVCADCVTLAEGVAA